MLGVGLDGSRPIRRIVWMIIGMINAHPTKIGCQGERLLFDHRIHLRSPAAVCQV
jgi:hypothetical protein